MHSKKGFLRLVNHPLKFRVYLLFKLPAAFFSGIKIKKCTEEKCITSVPFTWLTQNPFKSTYFASLAMAAEMSTGVLALCHTYKKSPRVSMLVTKLEAAYFKKATGITFFSCEEGSEISKVVNETISTGEGKTIKVKSTGTNKYGEIIAVFLITWSFKAKASHVSNE